MTDWRSPARPQDTSVRLQRHGRILPMTHRPRRARDCLAIAATGLALAAAIFTLWSMA